MPQPDLSDLWVKRQRQDHKTTLSWACKFCEDCQIFSTEDSLWKHCLFDHNDRLPAEDGEALQSFRRNFLFESAQKRQVICLGIKGSQPCRVTFTLFKHEADD